MKISIPALFLGFGVTAGSAFAANVGSAVRTISLRDASPYEHDRPGRDEEQCHDDDTPL